jgi:hypothetical protein
MSAVSRMSFSSMAQPVAFQLLKPIGGVSACPSGSAAAGRGAATSTATVDTVVRPSSKAAVATALTVLLALRTGVLLVGRRVAPAGRGW